jgi:hypothetical protein
VVWVLWDRRDASVAALLKQDTTRMDLRPASVFRGGAKSTIPSSEWLGGSLRSSQDLPGTIGQSADCHPDSIEGLNQECSGAGDVDALEALALGAEEETLVQIDSGFL